MVNAINNKKQRSRGNPIAKYFQRLKMVINTILIMLIYRKKKKNQRLNR